MSDWIIYISFSLFGLGEGFLFNVSRGGQGGGGDRFSNMNYSGTCSKANDDGRSWCVARNSHCSQQGCCICVCSYAFSTFRMDSSLDAAKCVENSYMRNFAGRHQLNHEGSVYLYTITTASSRKISIGSHY